MPVSLVPLILLAGVLTGLQPATNAMLARATGSAVSAALLSFAVGTAALGLAAAWFAPRPMLADLARLPWYAWAGGLYGAVFVTVAAYAAPRLGAGLTLTLLVAGQLAAALLLDQLGAFGLPRLPLTPARAAGAALLVAGVLLMRRG